MPDKYHKSWCSKTLEDVTKGGIKMKDQGMKSQLKNWKLGSERGIVKKIQ